MQASAACLNLIRVSEGLRFNPYRDVAGYWTVGYGHKLRADEMRAPVTYREAEDLLEEDVSAAEVGVNELTAGLMITQGQFDALVDFVYNLGLPALAESTLLRKLRAGDVMGASSEFIRWVHADVGGAIEVVDALVTRRMADRSMFLNGLPLT